MNATYSTSAEIKTDFEIRLNNFRKFRPLPELETSTFSCLWQLDKQQDFVWDYSNNDTIISIVADGHGTNSVVNYLRSLSDDYLYETCMLANPFEKLECDMENCINTSDSGACISIIRINSSSNLEIFWIGDTMTQVYKNGTKIAQTELHTAENPSEYERKTKEGALFMSEMGITRLPQITNNPHMSMKKILRCNHNPSDFMGTECLQMTRCAGHSALTSKPGENYGYKSIDFTESDNIKIITASDGVWDVIHEDENMSTIEDAIELVTFAAQRWCGDWNYVHHAEHRCKRCKCKKSNEQIISIQEGIPPDDISASVITLPKK